MVQDECDPVLAAVMERQPAGMPVLAAVRAALAELFDEFAPEDLERVYRRVKMILQVPALLGRQFQQSMLTQRLLAEGMAARCGRCLARLEASVPL